VASSVCQALDAAAYYRFNLATAVAAGTVQDSVGGYTAVGAYTRPLLTST
jgi:hypothetical protein